MNRTALLCSALFVSASALLYLFGLGAVLILGLVLCLVSAVGVIFRKRFDFGLKLSAVLLVGAAFCLFIGFYTMLKTDRIEALSGQRCIATCHVTEEPKYGDYFTAVEVKTDGKNGFDGGSIGKVKLYLYISNSELPLSISEGDVFTAELQFKEIEQARKKTYFSKGIFIDANACEIEIIGHDESVYTRCIDIRRSIRNTINQYTDGDSAALLQGILLGGTEEMSTETYSDFVACGVTHITAVSGMHISAICMMSAYLLRLILERRKASALALIPLVFEVMLAGFTPSAVRSAIMCSILLLANCFLKRADALNSLGLAAMCLLIFNPYYVCGLGFQLSCSATAGVIIIMPYATALADRIVKIDFKYLTKFLKGAVITVAQSLGAAIFTLPFQILQFGYISLVSLIANLMICTAAVMSIAAVVAGLVCHYIPVLNYFAAVPFFAANLLAKYICGTVKLLASIPFSYIPFGSRSAVLWLGFSLALIAVWLMLKRYGGVKAVIIGVAALLLVTLWSDYAFSRGKSTVAVINCENGLCTVVTYEETCVIIGCGDDYSDVYAVQEYMRKSGIGSVELLLLLSDSQVCFGGANGFVNRISPEVTIVPSNFGNTNVFSGKTEIAENGCPIYTKDGKISITPRLYDGGCAYELNLSGRKVVVGCGRFSADDIGVFETDVLISGRVLPYGVKSKITAVASKTDDVKYKLSDRTVVTSGRNISIKFKEGKGMNIYAGQG